ncbi:MAG: hypothetical protein DRJ15_00115 [Bacteroidetes bacterium]|nr:MAG: hypothetical protein DRJ15_00115 [Bacteroidota bacterium]
MSYRNTAIRVFGTKLEGNFIEGINFFGTRQCWKNLVQAVYINSIHFSVDLTKSDKRQSNKNNYDTP